MGTFLVFIGKLLSCCDVRIEEEELRDSMMIDGLQHISDNFLSSDFHGRRVLVSHVPSDISYCNARNENDGFNKSCWGSAESWLGCSKCNALQFHSGIEYDSLKETESDLRPVKITKEVSKPQNEQITAETSESLLSHPLSFDSTPHIPSNANATTVPLGSSENGYLLAETDSSLSLLGSRKNTAGLQKVTSVSHHSRSDTEIENNGVSSSHLNRESRSKVDVYSSIKELTSGESLSDCSQGNSLESLSGINYDGDDYIKEKVASLPKSSTESDLNPAKSKKKAPKQESKNATQLSSLISQNEKTTGVQQPVPFLITEGSTSITLLHTNANVVCAPNVQQLVSIENGCILVETQSSPNLVGSQNKQQVPQKKNCDDADNDISKGKLICLEKRNTRNTESESRPVKSKKEASKCKRRIQGYRSSHKILLVGEGDFSFSACIARAFGSATNMVATSLNSEEYLRSYYKSAMDNISDLRKRGCKVVHQVDATTIANHSDVKGQSFNRIIYNFPHCGDFSSTKHSLRKNRKLVRLFMKNSSKLIEQDGEIHIRHKTSSYFLQWDLKGLASEAGLVLIEEAPVHFREFEGYETKYGFEGGKFRSDDNFDRYPCLTYKFALPGHPKEMGLQNQNSKLNAG